jgi:mono/diheme cytochrome c family protein
VRFESAVRPVFQAKCASCHGTLSKRGGLDLRTLATTVRGGNSGPGVVPGRPGESPVWETVRTGQMPPPNKPQLTAAEKDLIRAWIAGGARP